jgi:hypothetical protein
MSEDTHHCSDSESDAAKYDQNSHPLPYEMKPQDLYTGIAIVSALVFPLERFALYVPSFH